VGLPMTCIDSLNWVPVSTTPSARSLAEMLIWHKRENLFAAMLRFCSYRLVGIVVRRTIYAIANCGQPAQNARAELKYPLKWRSGLNFKHRSRANRKHRLGRNRPVPPAPPPAGSPPAGPGDGSGDEIQQICTESHQSVVLRLYGSTLCNPAGFFSS
jgi:hypothetical protein